MSVTYSINDLNNNHGVHVFMPDLKTASFGDPTATSTEISGAFTYLEIRFTGATYV